MNDELKDLIIHQLDVTQLLDILGMDLSDLVEKLDDEIEENRQELFSACR